MFSLGKHARYSLCGCGCRTFRQPLELVAKVVFAGERHVEADAVQFASGEFAQSLSKGGLSGTSIDVEPLENAVLILLNEFVNLLFLCIPVAKLIRPKREERLHVLACLAENENSASFWEHHLRVLGLCMTKCMTISFHSWHPGANLATTMASNSLSSPGTYAFPQNGR